EGDPVLDGRVAVFALGEEIITSRGKTVGPVELDQMVADPRGNGQYNQDAERDEPTPAPLFWPHVPRPKLALLWATPLAHRRNIGRLCLRSRRVPDETRGSFFCTRAVNRPDSVRQKLLSCRGCVTHSLQVNYVGGIGIVHAPENLGRSRLYSSSRPGNGAIWR